MINESFESVIKTAYGTAFAVLNQRFHNIEQVEDALQYACLKALDKWQSQSISNIKAWLIKVATNYIFDEIKKHKPDYVDNLDPASPVDTAYQYDDATLGLIFTCCHPSISQENQLTLCLKWVMGFDNASISRALLINDKTLEQRITRAKRKISANQIEFALPTQTYLPTRLNSVNKVLYLIFNEGYFGNSGDRLFCNTLCMQAIYLMRLICRTFRGNASCIALLALMLFIQARAPARAAEKVVVLAEQDRSKWDKTMIAQADILLQKALKIGPPASYQIQAAIAGLHSQASTFEDTDWQQICLLYQKLSAYDDSPAIIINHAVALMHIKQWQVAEEKLHQAKPLLTNYPPLHIAYAFLFESTNRLELAIDQLNLALNKSKSHSEKHFLTEKLNALQQSKR